MASYLNPYNTPLGSEDMKTNAKFLASYLLAQGWTMHAICGALGNWESECKLNPNDPQTDASGFPSSSSSRAGGFGLAQWTPCGGKILTYCENKGLTPTASDDNPAGTIEIQIEYHEWECINGYNGGKTWYSNHGYSYSWADYKASTDDPSELATAYYWQYERSASGSPGTRPAQATAWYEYLTGIDLPDVGPVLSGKMSLMDLILYTKRGRKMIVV